MKIAYIWVFIKVLMTIYLFTNQLLTLRSSLLITSSILLDCIVSTQQLNVVSICIHYKLENFTGIRKNH